MGFTAIQLSVNDINPSPKTLGTLNALALTLASGIRAFTPGPFASLFAVGIKSQILKGYLAWVIMIVIAAGYALAVQWVSVKAEGKMEHSPA